MRPTVVLLLFLITYLTAFAQASFVEILEVIQVSESIKVRFSVAEGIEAVEQVVLKFEPVNGSSQILPEKSAIVGQSHFLAPGEYSLQWFPAWENRTLPKEREHVVILEVSYFDDRAMETLRSDNRKVFVTADALQSEPDTTRSSKVPPPQSSAPSKKAVSSDSTEVVNSMDIEDIDLESKAVSQVSEEEQAVVNLEEVKGETPVLDEPSDDSNLESDLSEKAEVIPDAADVLDRFDSSGVVDSQPKIKKASQDVENTQSIATGEKERKKSRLRSLFGGKKHKKALPIDEVKQIEVIDLEKKVKPEKKSDQAVYGIYSSKFNQ